MKKQNLVLLLAAALIAVVLQTTIATSTAAPVNAGTRLTSDRIVAAARNSGPMESTYECYIVCSGWLVHFVE